MNSEEILNYSLFELEEKRLLCFDLNIANQFWNQSKNKIFTVKNPKVIIFKHYTLFVSNTPVLSAFPVVTTCSLILGYYDKVIAYSRLTYNENLK